MKKKLVAGLAAGVFMLGIVGIADAIPIQWSSSTGGNDHWYDVITTNSAITWEQASVNASLNNWHLVTITSAEEDVFVSSLLENQRTTNAEYYWLGGYQPPNSIEPGGGWSWITGETWSYTNWNSGEPNNGVGGTQHYLHYWPEGTWNWDDIENRNDMVGYVMEQNPVPEPATMLLLGSGLLGLAGYGRKKFFKK